MIVSVGIVCGKCDWLNPVKSLKCDDCGASLSLDVVQKTPAAITVDATSAEGAMETQETPPTAAQQDAEGEPMEQARHYICKSCYSPVPGGHKFCGKCGTSAEDNEVWGEPNYFGDMQTPGKAKLILIKGEGMDGISYHLNSTEHVAGRVEGPILFTEDNWLSPKHANFYYDDSTLKVRDEGSANGVFFALHGKLTVETSTVFMAGEQVFRIEAVEPIENAPEEDETFFFASPHADISFRVIQILEGGGDGMMVNSKENVVTIGREGCDMNFPNDPYISGAHIQVEFSGGNLELTDLNSKNGTFVKISGEKELVHGDYIFLGRQLLRVEITG